MKTILYHEIAHGSKTDVLRKGIKRKATGAKTDAKKRKTDEFLDTHRPDTTKQQGTTRQNVTYAYLEYEGKIIDIRNGDIVPVNEFKESSKQLLLRLQVDPERCVVSDLDLYDTMQRALDLDEQDSTREHLADRYWQRTVPLVEFTFGDIRRPEVMINYDVKPDDIEVV